MTYRDTVSVYVKREVSQYNLHIFQVCGALMRPLDLTVNLEEEQEDDKFILNLPDGTSHKQVHKYLGG